MKKYFRIVFILIPFFGACASQEKTVQTKIQAQNFSKEEAYGVTPELRRIETADPEKDVLNAIKKGDIYFLAVNGFVQYTPGISSGIYRCKSNKTPIKVIDGTSDGLQSREHDRLNDLATKYAENFNTMMRQKLLQDDKIKCSGSK